MLLHRLDGKERVGMIGAQQLRRGFDRLPAGLEDAGVFSGRSHGQRRNSGGRARGDGWRWHLVYLWMFSDEACGSVLGPVGWVVDKLLRILLMRVMGGMMSHCWWVLMDMDRRLSCGWRWCWKMVHRGMHLIDEDRRGSVVHMRERRLASS